MKALHTKPWLVDSWQDYPVQQQPIYTDISHLGEVLEQVKHLPALVSKVSIQRLGERLRHVHDHDGIVLHAGDCAERFKDVTRECSAQKVWHLLCLASVLAEKSGREVVCIGRLGGQFAKPRSRSNDEHGFPIFRGDNIHSIAASKKARTPDPHRLLLGYYLSKLMIQDVHEAMGSFFHGGFYGESHGDERIEQEVMQRFGEKAESMLARYRDVAAEIFFSHEGLLLFYEQCFTRSVQNANQYWNLSSHLLWLGERTRSLGEGHLEYFRGIENPIAIKLSAKTQPHEFEAYLTLLGNKTYPLTLITRLGKEHVSSVLPWMIEMVQSFDGKTPMLWSCDPMHGSMHRSKSGQKTRLLTDMIEELSITHSIHRRMGSKLSGIHVEITHEQVCECLADFPELQRTPSLSPYTSYCDPRLNLQQSFDVIARAGEILSSL